jgi:hypothetical protein
MVCSAGITPRFLGILISTLGLLGAAERRAESALELCLTPLEDHR